MDLESVASTTSQPYCAVPPWTRYDARSVPHADTMTSNEHGSQQPQAQSSLSFTQGFLLGQLSVVLLIGAFIKFFIFGEASRSESPGPSRSQRSRKRSNSINVFSKDASTRTLREKQSVSNILRPVPSSSTNTPSILRKTYYNAVPTHPGSKNGRRRLHHSSHQPESLDWFNVLIAQTIAQYRQTAYILKDSPTSSIVASLTETINNPEKKPSFIDDIKVTDISLGEEFPIFSNCRVIAVDDPSSDGGRLQALMDVDVSDDNLSLAIETSLLVNYPKPRSAALPVALSVSVVRFSGTLCISLIPAPSDSPDPQSPTAATVPPTQSPPGRRPEPQFPPSTPDAPHSGPANERPTSSDSAGTSTGIPKTSLAFSFLPDYRLDLSVSSLIGSRSRLQDMPKVAQLVEARVQAWFEERVVEPRVQVVALPGLWPRMGRTGVRGQEEAEQGSGDEDYGGANNATAAMGGGFGAYTHDVAANDPGMEGLRYREPASGDRGLAANAAYGQGSSSRPDSFHEERYRIPGSLPQ